MTKAQLEAQLREAYHLEETELLLADGFEDACLGIIQSFTTLKVLYDRDRCLEILVARDGMTWEEAAEYFDFNVTGAYVGEGTPAFLVLSVDPPTVPSSTPIPSPKSGRLPRNMRPPCAGRAGRRHPPRTPSRR